MIRWEVCWPFPHVFLCFCFVFTPFLRLFTFNLEVHVQRALCSAACLCLLAPTAQSLAFGGLQAHYARLSQNHKHGSHMNSFPTDSVSHLKPAVGEQHIKSAFNIKTPHFPHLPPPHIPHHTKLSYIYIHTRS